MSIFKGGLFAGALFAGAFWANGIDAVLPPPIDNSWNPFATSDGFIMPRYKLQIKDKRHSKKRRDNDMLFLSH